MNDLRPLRVDLCRLDAQLPVPDYAHHGDAGAYLRAAHDAVIPAGGRACVGTAVAIALPSGYAAFVHPRSGLAARHGVSVLNAPGTVDAGYRGEIRVTMFNSGTSDFVVHRGDRIAQLVVQRVETVQFVEVPTLPQSDRGAAGFGSTGGFAVAPGGQGGTDGSDRAASTGPTGPMGEQL